MKRAGEGEGERVAKWLAHAGVASRREAERLIAEGRVAVNGRRLAHPAVLIEPGDVVLVDGVPVAPPARPRLFRYHKPRGLLVTARDPQGRPTIFDRLPPELPRVVSVGRLDMDSEGLLLLTTDGELARRLEHPENGWLRRYRVRVHGHPDQRKLAALREGIVIDGIRYGPIEAGLDAIKGANAWLTVSLREGKNREVRRVLEHLGHPVLRLIRVAFGPFQLGDLPRGAVAEVPAKVIRDQLGPEVLARSRRRHASEARSGAGG